MNEASLIAVLPCARVGQRMCVPGTARYSHTHNNFTSCCVIRPPPTSVSAEFPPSRIQSFSILTGSNRITQVRTCKEANCQQLCPFSRGFPRKRNDLPTFGPHPLGPTPRTFIFVSSMRPPIFSRRNEPDLKDCLLSKKWPLASDSGEQ